jgi:hypothetical protein
VKKEQTRITLVAGKQRNWNSSSEAASRIVLLDSVAMLRSTIASPLVRSDADVERIVLDRCCSEVEYLALLTELPHEFTGDVLMIREGPDSFLSATGRGGDRILYALSDDDVEFYLETVRLVARTEKMERGVLKFQPREIRVADVRTSAGENVAVKEDRAQSRQTS